MFLFSKRKKNVVWKIRIKTNISFSENNDQAVSIHKVFSYRLTELSYSYNSNYRYDSPPLQLRLVDTTFTAIHSINVETTAESVLSLSWYLTSLLVTMLFQVTAVDEIDKLSTTSYQTKATTLYLSVIKVSQLLVKHSIIVHNKKKKS